MTPDEILAATERDLLQILARLEQEHRERCRPYVEELARLKALRVPLMDPVTMLGADWAPAAHAKGFASDG